MNIEQYIKETRGCTLPISEQEQICCLHSVSDTMHCFDWIQNIKTLTSTKKLIEVRFKNNRKGIYENIEEIFLKRGDIVAVEALTGHDIGIVSLQGESIFQQIKKHDITSFDTIQKIYRKAKTVDIEKWHESLKRESKVIERTKAIIDDLSLNMKLTDVEFQGDGSKATFYYTADDRVDFRELIKILASEFKTRIEMKQIGARQESTRIGGIGTCGRELCCITWKGRFESVTTNAARHQELSLNPTKLAGQCGKLKCCLNYEIDTYIDAKKGFPDTSVTLKTKEGNAYFQKCDVFKKILWYSFDPENSLKITALTIQRVEEIIQMNKKAIIPETLLQDNVDLANLISNKHNVQITNEEIFDSNTPAQNNNKKKKNYKRYKSNKKNDNNE